ncbi:MAG: hypothetical protein VKL20_04770 [Synechocystis sp.]|nr:hypothetical protein [Synechocystis sp.]
MSRHALPNEQSSHRLTIQIGLRRSPFGDKLAIGLLNGDRLLGIDWRSAWHWTINAG